jgi:NADH dehydrogenase (ubiquinone) 1 alpha subcomplex subunit 9
VKSADFRGGRSSVSGLVATVFGATGFLGRYVVGRLARHGSQVVAPYRGTEYDARHLKVMGDIGQVVLSPYHLKDDASIREAVRRSHVVINLIGRDYDTKNFKLEECFEEGSARIARICQEENITNFVQVSSVGASASAESRILKSQAAAEAAVRSQIPSASILRLSPLIGPEDRYFQAIARWLKLLKSYPVVEGSTQVSPLWVKDAAAAVVDVAVGTDKEVLPLTMSLTGPETASKEEWIRVVSEAIGVETSCVPIPGFVAKAAGSMTDRFMLWPTFTAETVKMYSADATAASANCPEYPWEARHIPRTAINSKEALHSLAHFVAANSFLGLQTK